MIIIIKKNDVIDGEPYTWRRVSTVRGQADKKTYRRKTARRYLPSLHITRTKINEDMTNLAERIEGKYQLPQ